MNAIQYIWASNTTGITHVRLRDWPKAYGRPLCGAKRGLHKPTNVWCATCVKALRLFGQRVKISALKEGAKGARPYSPRKQLSTNVAKEKHT